MYDFFVRNALYLVLVIALIVWIGIAWYLNRLDGRLAQVERRMQDSLPQDKA